MYINSFSFHNIHLNGIVNPYFPDEANKAQRGEGTCPRSHSLASAQQRPKLSFLTPVLLSATAASFSWPCSYSPGVRGHRGDVDHGFRSSDPGRPCPPTPLWSGHKRPSCPLFTCLTLGGPALGQWSRRPSLTFLFPWLQSLRRRQTCWAFTCPWPGAFVSASEDKNLLTSEWISGEYQHIIHAT